MRLLAFSLFFMQIYNAIGNALLPAATYSYAFGDLKRVLKISFHSVWITFIISVVFVSSLFIFKDFFDSFFTTGADFSKTFKEVLPIFGHFSLWLLFLLLLALFSKQQISQCSLFGVPFSMSLFFLLVEL